MAAVVAASQAASGSGVTPWDVARPTGTADGHIMIAVVVTEFNASPSLPTGFRVLMSFDRATGANAGVRVKVGYRVAASEPVNYSFSQGAGSDGVGFVVAISGAQAAFKFAIHQRANATTLIAPTVSRFSASDVLLCGGASEGSGTGITWTAPGGMTEQTDLNSAGFASGTIASLAAPSDPSGTKSFTASSAGTLGMASWSLVVADSGASTTGIRQVADVASIHDIAAATSTVCTLQSPTDIATNNYLIARLALDNSGTAGVATTVSVTDPRSNTWTVGGAGNMTVGAANDGTSCRVAYAKVTTPYQAGDTITFNYGNSTTANAIVIEEWTGIDGTTPVAVAQTNAVGTSTTPSISRTASAVGQLMYGALAVEGPEGDAYTPDTDTTDGVWSNLSRTASISGTAASNQCVNGMYKIVTATGSQTLNPTLGTSRDWAMIALLFAPSSGSSTNVNVTEATATGDAQTLATSLATNPAAATATGDAQTPTINVNVNPATATATGDAFGPSVATSTSAQPQTATGVGDANGPAPSLALNPAEVTGTGVANDVTVTTSENAQPSTATATGAALDLTATVTVNPTLSLITGEAFDPVVSTAALTNVDVIEATATGAGFDAAVTVSESATVQTADVSGAANDVTVTVSETASPQTATATGQAFDGTSVLGVEPDVATTSGDASNVAAAVGARVGEALGVGQAQDATTTTSESVDVDVTPALADGDALDATATTVNDTVVQVDLADATGDALGTRLDVAVHAQAADALGNAFDATVLEAVAASVEVASAAGDAFDVFVDVDNDHLVAVDVALAIGQAYDVFVLGALPAGRVRRLHGNEPTNHARSREPALVIDGLTSENQLSGYATREPRRQLSGNEPRSGV